VAAAIAITCLIFKSQGYWSWNIVNAVLWFWLFWFQWDLKMLGGLQLMFIAFAIYGLFIWATTHHRIGFDIGRWKDSFGLVLGLAILVYAVIAFRYAPNFMTSWWYVEFAGVLISIIALWMDAYKYRTNWILWSMTNVLFFPLFIHQAGGLNGPAIMTILFQMLCFVGIYKWYKDQREQVEAGEVELVGGAKYA
jgi:nicotinamide riboside transporter PnuC